MTFTFFRRRGAPFTRTLAAKLDGEVQEEIRFYLEARTQELIETGSPPGTPRSTPRLVFPILLVS